MPEGLCDHGDILSSHSTPQHRNLISESRFLFFFLSNGKELWILAAPVDKSGTDSTTLCNIESLRKKLTCNFRKYYFSFQTAKLWDFLLRSGSEKSIICNMAIVRQRNFLFISFKHIYSIYRFQVSLPPTQSVSKLSRRKRAVRISFNPFDCWMKIKCWLIFSCSCPSSNNNPNHKKSKILWRRICYFRVGVQWVSFLTKMST